MRIAKGKSITAHDARQLSRFKLELELMVKLENEGHSRECAKQQVFTSIIRPELMRCNCKAVK